jgi:phenylpyruvate tautomerase PptA (4-oxalocrotonate tautomerase family)
MREILRKTPVAALIMALIMTAPGHAQREPTRRLVDVLSQVTSLSDNDAPSAVTVARLHYSGGGDWYWGGSAITNFLHYVDRNTDFPVDTIERQVTIMDADLFKYPFLFATGHGVISFSAEEKERLRC